MKTAELDKIDMALHGIDSMVEFAHRSLEAYSAEGDEKIFHIPYDDINLLDFAIVDIAQRVKALRQEIEEAMKLCSP
jgi:hypothetical protein